MSAYLVLRVDREDSRYSRKDYDGFRSHRVLRDIPRHSRKHGRLVRRLHGRARLHFIDGQQPTSASIVVGMPSVPRTISITVSRALTLLRTARTLSITNSRMRREPAATDRTWALLHHGAADDRRDRRRRSSRGHFCQADPGHFSRASKKNRRNCSPARSSIEAQVAVTQIRDGCTALVQEPSQEQRSLRTRGKR